MKTAYQMYTADPEYSGNLQYKTIRRIRAHRGWYVFEGLAFILLGIAAMMVPGLTTLAAEFLVGALLLAGGLLRMLNGLQFHYNRVWRVASGLGMGLVGAAMLYKPLSGMEALILFIGLLLVAEGFVQIIMALSFRSARGWGWLLFSGFIALALGIVVLGTGPVAGMMVTSFIIGLSLFFYGLALLLLTVSIK